MRRGTTLLMTRPGDANRRFLTLLPEDLLRELPVIQSPLMEIQPVATDLDLAGVSAVIFTSGEAVRIAGAHTRLRLRAYCVGEATAERARVAGWDAHCLGVDADAFVTRLLAQRPTGRILHLHGEFTRGEIVPRLARGGLTCTGQMIYRQLLCPLSAEAKAAIEARIPLIVPLFSPRTAAHFDSLRPDMTHLTLIAMSDAVVEAMPRLQSHCVDVSKVPTAEAMAEILRDVVASSERVETGRPDD